MKRNETTGFLMLLIMSLLLVIVYPGSGVYGAELPKPEKIITMDLDDYRQEDIYEYDYDDEDAKYAEMSSVEQDEYAKKRLDRKREQIVEIAELITKQMKDEQHQSEEKPDAQDSTGSGTPAQSGA